MLSLPEQLITEHRAGFQEGYTSITREADNPFEPGVDFGIHVMQQSKQFTEKHAKESVWVLLAGAAEIEIENSSRSSFVQRSSLFDEAPTALHLAPNTTLHISSRSERLEWAVARVENTTSFASKLYRPEELTPEYRGDRLAQGTCLRNVRLIFDHKVCNEANLVIGEVINYPGRWSSYPPHHHEQPEIYHYRFDKPQGYGHGEVGEEVYRLQSFDTLRIPGGHDHAQVSAPGYAMYYLWIVRHLENNPYTGFEFTPEHEWLLNEKTPIWEPREGPFPGRRGRG